MRQTRRTIAAMIGATGLAIGASAQEECSQSSECSDAKSSSCTTINATGDGGSYEIRIENGELMVVKVDGKKVDLAECDFDQEAGTLVVEFDGGEPFVVEIPSFSGTTFGPITTDGNMFFTGEPESSNAPRAIQWADAPEPPRAPGTIFYDDGKQSSWSVGGHEPPRVMIGITHDEVDEEHRHMFDLDEGEGIFIIGVREGLPAEEAGVRVKDVIIEVNGEHIKDRGVLAEILDDREPGDKLRIVVLRANDDGDVIKKKLKIELDEYNGFVLRGDGGERLHEMLLDGEWLELDGKAHKFPGGEDFTFFNEFDFEMPKGLDDLPEDVREEVMRALESARERAHDTQSRAFRLRADLGEPGSRQHKEQLESLHEQLGQLRENGVDIQIQMGDELKSLRELGLRLHELGGNEQIIRSAPNGRAFIIEREARERAINQEHQYQERQHQERQRQERSNERRLRTERDSLRDRNRSLEDRVEALERRLVELMERLEERNQ